MKPHELKPFAVHRAADAITPIATWDGCALEELLAEHPMPADAPGPWLASVYQRLVVASTGPVALGRVSTRLDRAGWFHAGIGADLDKARAACWPALPRLRELALGVGSPAAKLVLVGENAPKGQLPFHSRSGTWLWRALRVLGWDELSCYVTNAFAYALNRRPQGSELKHLRDALSDYHPLWVALGQKASMVLSGAGIVHVSVDHPQNWARYRHADGPQGYAAHLQEKGVAPGPWHGAKLPSLLLEGEPVLASRLGIPHVIAHRPEPGTKRVSGGKGITEAHRFFVVGVDDKGNKVQTLADAAKAAGAFYGRVSKVAREENWFKERDDHQAKTLEKAKEKTSDLEAQKIATCRALAWTATSLGLGSVVKRLKDPSGDLAKGIDPRQVLAIGKLALLISGLGDPTTSDELKRVQQLTNVELLAEYRKTLEAFGVKENDKP